MHKLSIAIHNVSKIKKNPSKFTRARPSVSLVKHLQTIPSFILETNLLSAW